MKKLLRFNLSNLVSFNILKIFLLLIVCTNILANKVLPRRELAKDPHASLKLLKAKYKALNVNRDINSLLKTNKHKLKSVEYNKSITAQRKFLDLKIKVLENQIKLWNLKKNLNTNKVNIKHKVVFPVIKNSKTNKNNILTTSRQKNKTKVFIDSFSAYLNEKYNT